MLWIKTISTRNINLLLGILCICFVLFSCEAEDVYPTATFIEFELPEVVSVNEQVNISLQAEGDYDAVEWSISDGSEYHNLQFIHQFSESGSYTIEVKTFLNGILTSSLAKDIDVYYSNKTISLSEPIFAQEVFYTGNKIILRASNKELETLDNTSNYLILDQDLNLLSEINNPEEIVNELESIVKLGDSVLAISSNINNSQSFSQYKSTSSKALSNSANNAFTNYSRGYIYKRNEGENGFFVDYYNEANEKLWTKSFEDGYSNSSKYVFNINNKLFYLSFDENSGKVYIEKFKNPSVVFKKDNFSLRNSTSPKEVLFAFNNTATNSIVFAIYSYETDESIIYNLQEDCSLETLASFNARLEGKPQFCTSNGAIIVTDKNEITKYSTDWSVIISKTLNKSNFGICPMGDNLNLLYENLPSGEIRLSYLDKHLGQVLF